MKTPNPLRNVLTLLCSIFVLFTAVISHNLSAGTRYYQVKEQPVSTSKSEARALDSSILEQGHTDIESGSEPEGLTIVTTKEGRATEPAKRSLSVKSTAVQGRATVKTVSLAYEGGQYVTAIWLNAFIESLNDLQADDDLLEVFKAAFPVKKRVYIQASEMPTSASGTIYPFFVITKEPEQKASDDPTGLPPITIAVTTQGCEGCACTGCGKNTDTADINFCVGCACCSESAGVDKPCEAGNLSGVLTVYFDADADESTESLVTVVLKLSDETEWVLSLKDTAFPKLSAPSKKVMKKAMTEPALNTK
ncbi:hypothetical protein [Spongorhabdus nitratireducens]